MELIPKCIEKPKTKRELASQIASLYDPLGLLAPIVIKAKILLQEIWALKTDWDVTLPDHISMEWEKQKAEMVSVKQIKFPRWLKVSTNSTNELHAFCDASAKAYAAVVYIKTIEKNEVSVSLATAKYKVAPLKTMTIPRLELSAAALLAKLVKKVIDSTKINFNSVKLYTDSKITLDWINGNPKRWRTFVQNKVIGINKCTSKDQWSHIPTKINPADCASRGLFASELLNHPLWFNGPEFLHSAISTLPDNQDEPRSYEASEENATIVSLNATVEREILPKASTYFKFKKIIAYCNRFTDNYIGKTKKFGQLSVVELDRAERSILRLIQMDAFSIEIELLKNKKQLPRNSKLLNLAVFLDSDDILRVGGRLINSDLPRNWKHQILLPSKHSVKKLIILEAHIHSIHRGPKLTEAQLKKCIGSQIPSIK